MNVTRCLLLTQSGSSFCRLSRARVVAIEDGLTVWKLTPARVCRAKPHRIRPSQAANHERPRGDRKSRQQEPTAIPVVDSCVERSRSRRTGDGFLTKDP